jgi:hypothetical protein
MRRMMPRPTGLALTKAFTRVKDAKLRRRIAHLVEQIAGDNEC